MSDEITSYVHRLLSRLTPVQRAAILVALAAAHPNDPYIQVAARTAAQILARQHRRAA